MTEAISIDDWLRIPKPIDTSSFDGESGDGATARALLIGEDLSDPAATGTDIFTDPNNLPTAVATLLNHSQNRANFHPLTMEPEELAKYFGAYLREIDLNPFFSISKTRLVEHKFESSDYNVLIDQIVSLYDGVTAESMEDIKNSITKMAKSVFGEVDAEDWDNLFEQTTMDMESGALPLIRVYSTSLHMKRESGGIKPDVDLQDYTVRKAEYFVLSDKIVVHANRLAELEATSVDDWATGATTPERSNAKLCFDPMPYARRLR